MVTLVLWPLVVAMLYTNTPGSGCKNNAKLEVPFNVLWLLVSYMGLKGLISGRGQSLFEIQSFHEAIYNHMQTNSS